MCFGWLGLEVLIEIFPVWVILLCEHLGETQFKVSIPNLLSHTFSSQLSHPFPSPHPTPFSPLFLFPTFSPLFTTLSCLFFTQRFFLGVCKGLAYSIFVRKELKAERDTTIKEKRKGRKGGTIGRRPVSAGSSSPHPFLSSPFGLSHTFLSRLPC